MLLLAAGVTSLVALTWLALSNDVHWEQVHGESAPPPQTAKLLRALGTLGLAASFGLCMAADHASMAVLVWVMLVPACTLAVAMTLAWRPALLRLLWAAGR
ncbi:MAG: DUF3325 domain-containing protein [Comamonadaceae bacterium]|nr:MAG: DUF3325 domain-containing protein [Comamonadaceae bacterium]